MLRTLALVGLVASTARADKGKPPVRPSVVDSAAAIQGLTKQIFPVGTALDPKAVLPLLAARVTYAGITYFEKSIEAPTEAQLACAKRFGAKGTVEGDARTAFVACGGFWASADSLTETTWNHLPKNLAKFAAALKPLAGSHTFIEGEFYGALVYSTVYTLVVDADGKAHIDGIYSFFAVP